MHQCYPQYWQVLFLLLFCTHIVVYLWWMTEWIITLFFFFKNNSHSLFLEKGRTWRIFERDMEMEGNEGSQPCWPLTSSSLDHTAVLSSGPYIFALSASRPGATAGGYSIGRLTASLRDWLYLDPRLDWKLIHCKTPRICCGPCI